MKKYITANEIGAITAEYSLPDTAQPPTGSIEVPDGVGGATHWVNGAEIASYTEAEINDMADQPSSFHRWRPGIGWEDPRTLVDLKAAKNDAINRARAAANSSYFTFQGHRIAADPLSRSDIDAAHGAILMTQTLPPGWPGGWKSMENAFVPITTVAEWAQFYGTMVATGTANFNHAQVLKAQLAAATTPEEVEAVPSW